MNNIYAESMNKNKHSNTKSEKYEILANQNIIDNNNNLINLKEIIKENNLIIFEKLLTKITKTVIKICKSDMILKEYKTSCKLSNIDGFIKYICYFSCNNNVKKIIENSMMHADKDEDIKILLMKKYKLGDIKNYNWNFGNFNILKSLIKQIFVAFFEAFNSYGFVHCNVHFGNFLIKKIKNGEYKVIIMDFEISFFDLTKNEYIVMLNIAYMVILSDILWKLNIVTENLDIITDYINTNREKLIDIDYLLSLIDNIIMIEKRDFTQMFYK